jgi:hypothetical protein
VSLFGRRSEPLHARLLREAGLDAGPAPDRARLVPPGPPPPVNGIHGVQRAREWDAVAAVVDPELHGTEHSFVVLEEGEIVAADVAPAALAPLVAAIGGGVARPYRAEAIRRAGDLWAVSARHVDLLELGVEGEELTLTVADGRRELVVDGFPRPGGLPELELRRGLPAAFHAVGTRVDETRWEIDLLPL